MSGKIILTIVGQTDVGRERTNNEDVFVAADARTGEPVECTRRSSADITRSSVVLAVADGMGGENAGEVASRLAVTSLRRALAKELEHTRPASALRSALEHANDVVAGGASAAAREGMGAILVAALFTGDEVHIAAAGDSRVYALRGSELIAAFPHKNVILQAIGRAAASNVPVGRLELRRDDALLLCSDGLSAEVADDEIREILMTVAPLDAACERRQVTAHQSYLVSPTMY